MASYATGLQGNINSGKGTASSPSMNVALFVVSLTCFEAVLLLLGEASSPVINASSPVYSIDLDPLFTLCKYVPTNPWYLTSTVSRIGWSKTSATVRKTRTDKA